MPQLKALHAALPPCTGGIILGISTTLWLHTSGQVTGISGFVRGLIDPARLAKGGAEFKGAWVTAFMAVAAFLSLAEPSWVGVGDRPDATAAGYIIGGFLVGLGTSMSNGCTSVSVCGSDCGTCAANCLGHIACTGTMLNGSSSCVNTQVHYVVAACPLHAGCEPSSPVS